ncbi:hypothetical protein BC833DRAFT_50952 [Globomyces pollinis-pini]|nr:hypothetical protein BC833DRAFT_50952 [Globomyces pollinis-pini]
MIEYAYNQSYYYHQQSLVQTGAIQTVSVHSTPTIQNTVSNNLNTPLNTIARPSGSPGLESSLSPPTTTALVTIPPWTTLSVSLATSVQTLSSTSSSTISSTLNSLSSPTSTSKPTEAINTPQNNSERLSVIWISLIVLVLIVTILVIYMCFCRRRRTTKTTTSQVNSVENNNQTEFITRNVVPNSTETSTANQNTSENSPVARGRPVGNAVDQLSIPPNNPQGSPLPKSSPADAYFLPRETDASSSRAVVESKNSVGSLTSFKTDTSSATISPKVVGYHAFIYDQGNEVAFAKPADILPFFNGFNDDLYTHIKQLPTNGMPATSYLASNSGIQSTVVQSSTFDDAEVSVSSNSERFILDNANHQAPRHRESMDSLSDAFSFVKSDHEVNFSLIRPNQLPIHDEHSSTSNHIEYSGIEHPQNTSDYGNELKPNVLGVLDQQLESMGISKVESNAKVIDWIENKSEHSSLVSEYLSNSSIGSKQTPSQTVTTNRQEQFSLIPNNTSININELVEKSHEIVSSSDVKDQKFISSEVSNVPDWVETQLNHSDIVEAVTQVKDTGSGSSFISTPSPSSSIKKVHHPTTTSGGTISPLVTDTIDTAQVSSEVIQDLSGTNATSRQLVESKVEMADNQSSNDLTRTDLIKNEYLVTKPNEDVFISTEGVSITNTGLEQLNTTTENHSVNGLDQLSNNSTATSNLVSNVLPDSSEVFSVTKQDISASEKVKLDTSVRNERIEENVDYSAHQSAISSVNTVHTEDVNTNSAIVKDVYETKALALTEIPLTYSDSFSAINSNVVSNTISVVPATIDSVSVEKQDVVVSKIMIDDIQTSLNSSKSDAPSSKISAIPDGGSIPLTTHDVTNANAERNKLEKDKISIGLLSLGNLPAEESTSLQGTDRVAKYNGRTASKTGEMKIITSTTTKTMNITKNTTMNTANNVNKLVKTGLDNNAVSTQKQESSLENQTSQTFFISDDLERSSNPKTSPLTTSRRQSSTFNTLAINADVVDDSFRESDEDPFSAESIHQNALPVDGIINSSTQLSYMDLNRSETNEDNDSVKMANSYGSGSLNSVKLTSSNTNEWKSVTSLQSDSLFSNAQDSVKIEDSSFSSGQLDVLDANEPLDVIQEDWELMSNHSIHSDAARNTMTVDIKREETQESGDIIAKIGAAVSTELNVGETSTTPQLFEAKGELDQFQRNDIIADGEKMKMDTIVDQEQLIDHSIASNTVKKTVSQEIIINLNENQTEDVGDLLDVAKSSDIDFQRIQTDIDEESEVYPTYHTTDRQQMAVNTNMEGNGSLELDTIETEYERFDNESANGLQSSDSVSIDMNAIDHNEDITFSQPPNLAVYQNDSEQLSDNLLKESVTLDVELELKENKNDTVLVQIDEVERVEQPNSGKSTKSFWFTDEVQSPLVQQPLDTIQKEDKDNLDEIVSSEPGNVRDTFSAVINDAVNSSHYMMDSDSRHEPNEVDEVKILTEISNTLDSADNIQLDSVLKSTNDSEDLNRVNYSYQEDEDEVLTQISNALDSVTSIEHDSKISPLIGTDINASELITVVEPKRSSVTNDPKPLVFQDVSPPVDSRRITRSYSDDSFYTANESFSDAHSFYTAKEGYGPTQSESDLSFYTAPSSPRDSSGSFYSARGSSDFSNRSQRWSRSRLSNYSNNRNSQELRGLAFRPSNASLLGPNRISSPSNSDLSKEEPTIKRRRSSSFEPYRESISSLYNHRSQFGMHGFSYEEPIFPTRQSSLYALPNDSETSLESNESKASTKTFDENKMTKSMLRGYVERIFSNPLNL